MAVKFDKGGLLSAADRETGAAEQESVVLYSDDQGLAVVDEPSMVERFLQRTGGHV